MHHPKSPHWIATNGSAAFTLKIPKEPYSPSRRTLKSLLQYLDTTDCSRFWLSRWTVKTAQRLLFPVDEGSNKTSAPAAIYCIPVSSFFRASKPGYTFITIVFFKWSPPDKGTSTTRKSHIEAGCYTHKENEFRPKKSQFLFMSHYVILEKPLSLPMGKLIHSKP